MSMAFELAHSPRRIADELQLFDRDDVAETAEDAVPRCSEEAAVRAAFGVPHPGRRMPAPLASGTIASSKVNVLDEEAASLREPRSPCKAFPASASAASATDNAADG